VSRRAPTAAEHALDCLRALPAADRAHVLAQLAADAASPACAATLTIPPGEVHACARRDAGHEEHDFGGDLAAAIARAERAEAIIKAERASIVEAIQRNAAAGRLTLARYLWNASWVVKESDYPYPLGALGVDP
jgi:hypothetical protein